MVIELLRHRADGTTAEPPLSGLRPEMLVAIDTAARIWAAHGLDALRVTSTTDGFHSRESFHYLGLAVDLARTGVPLGVASELSEELGADYQVIIEPDHIHVEYDPRSIRHRLREVRPR